MSIIKQRGLTIFEALVGISIALIIIAAVMTLFSNTLMGSQRVLERGKLDRDLYAAMDIMTYDIQRAGYWLNATSSSTTNPFMSATDNLPVNASGNCITVAYDRATNGVLSTNDQFGYATNAGGKAILFRQGGTTCAATGAGTGWQNLTDTNVITISAFQVSTTNVPLALTGGTNASTTYRTATITLTGNLNDAPTNSRTITRTIKVFNNSFSP